jgi:Predicted ATPase (AAA+ superfamily)
VIYLALNNSIVIRLIVINLNKETEFRGREWEISELNKAYSKGAFEMVVIYGRRRVGKTSIIKEFCKDKKTIFFPSVQSSIGDNLEILAKGISTAFKDDMPAIPPFKRFSDALDFIAAKGDERIVFVIDEYPYLANADPSVSSTLQHMIDHVLRYTKIMMILCGSSMSFMEYQVLGYNSPLFGRRTQQYKVLPFNYYESGKWFPEYSNEDKAIAYSATGGIPAYLAKMTSSVSIGKNIENTFFEMNSFLFEEPSNLLKQELREPAVYNSIITAIADGASKLSDISNKTKEAANKCLLYIDRLISLGIIAKETPITEKESARKTIYRIVDGMFRFWFKFVRENLAEIHLHGSEGLYDDNIKPKINQFMGLTFEDMSKEYIFRNYRKIGFKIGRIGKWWGGDPKTKKQEEIDIVAVSPQEDRWMFCECKYTTEKVGFDVLEDLKRRSELVTGNKDKLFFLFSKSGFTDSLVQQRPDNVRLVTLDDMYA